MNFSGPVGNFSGGGLGLFTKGFIIKMSAGTDTLKQKGFAKSKTSLEELLTVGKHIDYKEGKKLRSGIIQGLVKNSEGQINFVKILDEFEKIKSINVTQIDLTSFTGEPNDSSRKSMVNVSTIGIDESLDFLKFINDIRKI